MIYQISPKLSVARDVSASLHQLAAVRSKLMQTAIISLTLTVSFCLVFYFHSDQQYYCHYSDHYSGTEL